MLLIPPIRKLKNKILSAGALTLRAGSLSHGLTGVVHNLGY